MPKKHNKRSTPPTTTTEKIILKPVYETAAAACRYGKVRKNHGLEILIAPNYQNYSLAYTKGKNRDERKKGPLPPASADVGRQIPLRPA